MKSPAVQMLVLGDAAVASTSDDELASIAKRVRASSPDLWIVMPGRGSQSLRGDKRVISYQASGPAVWSRSNAERPGAAYQLIRDSQEAADVTASDTIAILGSEQELGASSAASAVFFVGPESHLLRAYGNLVPLWGQGLRGLLNVLQYFERRQWTPRVIEHGDVVSYVDRAIEFYRSAGAARVLYEQHRELSAELRAEFPREVVGVFGTGFPFYCFGATDSFDDNVRTPPSILEYLHEQRNYFASKLLPRRTFERARSSVINAATADQSVGVTLDRNVFDLREYESRGVTPPKRPRGSAALEVWHAAGAVAVSEDLWPCHLCIGLQAPDLVPHQQVLKDTNETCLRCKQTPLILRNVTTAGPDLDLTVIVDGDLTTMAAAVRDHTLHRSTRYLYDLDLERTIFNIGDGPADLFITTRQNLREALAALGQPNWLTVGFRSIALWSLTLHDHFFNLGEDFALSFVPQHLDSSLAEELVATRQSFARAHSHAAVLDALRNHSLAHRHVLSNPAVVGAVQQRLRSWSRLR